MEHEKQKGPVAQFTSAHSTTSAVDLSDRGNKDNLVVKEEETYDADAFEKVEVEVVNLEGAPIIGRATTRIISVAPWVICVR